MDVLHSQEIGTDYTDYEELRAMGLDEEEIQILKDSDDVRCSTPDPTQYHDPQQVALEADGSLISEHMRRGPKGLSGVVIPRATRGGGSKGFDSNQPAQVNIIDLKAGTKVSIDLSDLSNNQLQRAVDPEISEDMGTVAAIAFHRLAKQQNASFAQISDSEQLLKEAQDEEEPRVAPRGMGGAYVVPKSTRGGRQMQTPAARPKGPRKPPQVTVAQQENAKPTLSQTLAPVPRINNGTPEKSLSAIREKINQAQPPSVQVHFEHEGVYEMLASYHGVAFGEVTLVLVYDTRWTQGNRFEPKPTDDAIFLNIVGQPEIYRVFVSGEKYVFEDKEHQLFFIEDVFEPNQ